MITEEQLQEWRRLANDFSLRTDDIGRMAKAVPSLLDEVERLRSEVKQVQSIGLEWVHKYDHMEDQRNAIEDERDALRAEKARLRGLLHSEQIADMHYCETCEMAYQLGEGAVAECPRCECHALRARVAKLEAVVEAARAVERYGEMSIRERDDIAKALAALDGETALPLLTPAETLERLREWARKNMRTELVDDPAALEEQP